MDSKMNLDSKMNRSSADQNFMDESTKEGSVPYFHSGWGVVKAVTFDGTRKSLLKVFWCKYRVDHGDIVFDRNIFSRNTVTIYNVCGIDRLKAGGVIYIDKYGRVHGEDMDTFLKYAAEFAA